MRCQQCVVHQPGMHVPSSWVQQPALLVSCTVTLISLITLGYISRKQAVPMCCACHFLLLQVCDFGISKMKDASLAASSTRLQAGTPAYMVRLFRRLPQQLLMQCTPHPSTVGRICS